MRRITFALAVALSLTLVLPTALSAWSLPGAWADPGALWSTVQTWILPAWTGTKDGMHMDPDGAPTRAEPESRTIIDPNGAPSDESRTIIDPEGAPSDEPASRMIIDPAGASGG